MTLPARLRDRVEQKIASLVPGDNTKQWLQSLCTSGLDHPNLSKEALDLLVQKAPADALARLKQFFIDQGHIDQATRLQAFIDQDPDRE